MTERITAKDIEWFEKQYRMQSNDDYRTIAFMELKLAKAVKEIQEVIIKNDIH